MIEGVVASIKDISNAWTTATQRVLSSMVASDSWKMVAGEGLEPPTRGL
jgi:hypothetical protein